MTDKVIEEIIARVSKNIDELSEAQAKQMQKDLMEAMIVLFVGAEPKLADPSIKPDEKILPFFKAIAKMAGEGIHAFMMQSWNDAPMKKFEKKIEKFKNLESALTLLTK